MPDVIPEVSNAHKRRMRRFAFRNAAIVLGSWRFLSSLSTSAV